MRLMALFLAAVVGFPTLADEASDLAQWRKTRIERLTAEESWTSLIGLHWLDPGATATIGSSADSDIVIETLPAQFGTISHAGDAWQLALADKVSIEVDGQSATGTVALKTDATEAPATKVKFGSVSFILIERAGRVGMRVWDSHASSRLKFAGIESFPATDDWRFQARWEAHDPVRQIDIATVIGTVEPMENPGAAIFEREGKTYRLEALLETGSDELFFIFADRTSGASTYGAGRYLYAPMPISGTNTITLDFNRAYNPPCAFSAFATCPLPPPENRLDLAVEAGEMKYAKHATE